MEIVEPEHNYKLVYNIVGTATYYVTAKDETEACEIAQECKNEYHDIEFELEDLLEITNED